MRENQSEEEGSDTPPPLHLSQGKVYMERQRVPRFAWESRWLRGHEYGLMLKRVDDYCARFGLQKHFLNEHPPEIYEKPVNGALYFMHGNSLERFGFPRIERKKKYCWKKMNFITNLPKRHPEIKYIVASSYLAASMTTDNPSQYRMHVSTLSEGGAYLLCHIRKISGEEDDHKNDWLEECFEGNQPDLYRLFMHLHNHHHLTQ